MNSLRRPQVVSPETRSLHDGQTRRSWGLTASLRMFFARRLVRPTGLIIVALAFVAHSAPASALLVQQATPEGAVTSHVLIISLDGLRPDAITAETALGMA